MQTSDAPDAGWGDGISGDRHRFQAIHRLLFHILEGWLSILQYGAGFRMI
jgi:hypothetical protein